jgi:hypothetical protein
MGRVQRLLGRGHKGWHAVAPSIALKAACHESPAPDGGGFVAYYNYPQRPSPLRLPADAVAPW